MVVVVQLLAANDQAPGREIRAGVGRLVVAVAPVVPHAVDHARRPERNPDHLHGPDSQAQGAEQSHIDDEHQRGAEHRMAVDIALHPVIGRAVAELLQRFPVRRFGAVQLGATAHDSGQASHLRTVGVVDGLATRVVLAVDGHPFPGAHARAQPEPEAEEMRGHRPQVQRAVCLAAVQEDRHRRDRDVRGRQRIQQHLPPGKAPGPVGGPIDCSAPDFIPLQRHWHSFSGASTPRRKNRPWRDDAATGADSAAPTRRPCTGWRRSRP